MIIKKTDKMKYKIIECNAEPNQFGRISQVAFITSVTDGTTDNDYLKRLDNTFIYISNGTWFVKNTKCKLDIIDNNPNKECNCGLMGGIFIGEHIIDSPHESEVYKQPMGEKRMDSELCNWDEFNIYDSQMNLLLKATEDN